MADVQRTRDLDNRSPSALSGFTIAAIIAVIAVIAYVMWHTNPVSTVPGNQPFPSSSTLKPLDTPSNIVTPSTTSTMPVTPLTKPATPSKTPAAPSSSPPVTP